MKKTKQSRCTLLLKFWNDGNEEHALEGVFTTDSLRAARSEFRKKLKQLLYGDKLRPEETKAIVEAGYVVAAGRFVNGTDRFAMMLRDQKNPVEHPPMYAFTIFENGFHLQRFDPE